MNTSIQRIGQPLLKFAIALLGTVVVLWIVHQDVELNHGIVENGCVETMQVVLCGISAALMWVAARRHRPYGRALTLLALTLVAMTFRELDDVLDKLLFHGSWVFFAGPVGVVFVCLALRHFHETLDSTADLLETPSGRHLEIGLLILLVFSRVMGSKIIWQHLVSENAFGDIQVLRDIPITEEAFGYLSRAAKNAVEEGLELFAYLLIALAAIELLCAAPAARGDDGVPAKRG